MGSSSSWKEAAKVIEADTYVQHSMHDTRKLWGLVGVCDRESIVTCKVRAALVAVS